MSKRSKTIVNPLNTASRHPVKPFQEVGVAGVKASGGFIVDDFLKQLNGVRGRRIYRQMRDNDATISAIMFGIEMLFRGVPWSTSTDVIGPEAEKQVEFLESVLFKDMAHSWDDVMSNILSMLTYGWQFSEVTYKRRIGPYETDPARRSNYTDGLIGIRKISDRAQETLFKWDLDPDTGEVFGMIQQPPTTGNLRYIPIEKALLFQPHVYKESPEGRSVLRGAYVSWYNLSNLQTIELIAAERELAGFPVLYLPNEWLTSSDPQIMAKVDTYLQAVRDIKLNNQGGLILPSDVQVGPDGRTTNMRRVELQLMSAAGQRSIDIDKSIRRYQGDVARTLFADFVMLGQTSQQGSFALSRSKIDLFTAALQGWLESIAATFNRDLIPKLWRMNGFSLESMPFLVPGKVSPDDVKDMGEYIKALTASGIFLADEDTENHLRRVGGLPEAPIGGSMVSHGNTIPEDEEPVEDDNTNIDEEVAE